MGEEAIPGLDLADITGLTLQYLYAMLRVGAFVVASPLFSARFVPLPVRIIFAAVLALPVMATAELPEPETLGQLGAIRWVIAELAIGVACGLLLQVIFAAAVMAGDMIAATAGLGFAAQIDPASGSQSPVISQFLGMFLLAVFVSLDGHLIALGLVIDSLRYLPPGEGVDGTALIAAGQAAGSAMFAFAARLMMPLVSILLIVNIVIGLITRSAPQLNIFSFGFPLTMSTTVVLLLITVPAQAPVFTNLVGDALDAVETMLMEASGG